MDLQGRDAPPREVAPSASERVASCIGIASLVLGIASTVFAMLPWSLEITTLLGAFAVAIGCVGLVYARPGTRAKHQAGVGTILGAVGGAVEVEVNVLLSKPGQMLLLGTMAVLVVTAALIPTVVRERPGMSQKVAYGTVGFSLLLSGISTVLALGSTGAASEFGFLAYPFAILYSGLGFRITRPATLARALAVGGMAFGGTALAAVMMHWIKVQSVLQECGAYPCPPEMGG